MTTFAELTKKAEQLWHELTADDKPWIRIGTASCGHAAGAAEVVEAVKAELQSHNIDAHVDEVGCFGLCYAEPLVDVMQPEGSRLFFRNITPEDVPTIIEEYLIGKVVPDNKVLGYLGSTAIPGAQDMSELPVIKMQQKIALRNAGVTAPGGYQGLNKALHEMQPKDVIEEMKKSGLRGRGGAAFSTGMKWSFMVNSPGPTKYILCNCEEGDPGAYNDKGILESDPYTLIEGATLGGYATGASNGIVFIRHGHDGPIDRAEEAIRQAYANGLLGKNILGSDFSFEMEVALCGDSYVAGEETALMESIEGKRSMPRSRPPFPAASGLWGKPSTINNIKSLSYAPEIISRGGAWFASIGVKESKGTAIVCLSGDIEYAGMYEVPLGLTIRQVIEDLGGGAPEGKQIKLLQTGGPLGGVLSSASFDVVMDFEEMRTAGAILGSGGIIVADEGTCAVDLTRNLVAFCQYESCSKCFPCRLGMTQLLDIVERIVRFEGTPGDLAMLSRIGATMKIGSLCGHGQLGFNPIQSALTHFGADFDAHINEKRCPTGRCNETPLLSPRNTRPFAEDARMGQKPVELMMKLDYATARVVKTTSP